MNESMTRKVSDMTAGELRVLIHQCVMEIIDPDYGLELREDVKEQLHESVQKSDAIPLSQVRKDFGMQ